MIRFMPRAAGCLLCLLALALAPLPALAQDSAAQLAKIAKADALLKKCLPEHRRLEAALQRWAESQLKELRALEAEGALTEERLEQSRQELAKRKNELARKSDAIRKAWGEIRRAKDSLGLSGGQPSTNAPEDDREQVRLEEAIEDAYRAHAGPAGPIEEEGGSSPAFNAVMHEIEKLRPLD